MTDVALDANVLVGVVDQRDHWHSQSASLVADLTAGRHDLIAFGSSVIEALGVFARRCEHQGRSAEHVQLVAGLRAFLDASGITWTDPRFRFDDAIELSLQHHGLLNVNDALLALDCQAAHVRYILSFDKDFDLVPWLARVSTPEDAAAIPSAATGA